jgi:hypothetical protein
MIGMVIGYVASRSCSTEAVQSEAPKTAARARIEDAEGSPGESEIASFRTALAEERDRIRALEFQVEMLREALVMQSQAADDDSEAAEEAPGDRADLGHATGAEPEQDWFDQPALRSQGIDADRATWLEERFEELQMAELYLRDEATREGWLGTPRYRNELLKLRAETRESLTEENYDLLLYAAGRNNRVIVHDLLKTSPAAGAGVEPGDIVLRYGDQKVLTPRDLILGTSNADLRGTVPVDLWRNGERVRVYLPPGPLGVRLEAVRRFPVETGS